MLVDIAKSKQIEINKFVSVSPCTAERPFSAL
jgi:hypothetical protein